MSRSYKKHAYSGDKQQPWTKKWAKKKARNNLKDIDAELENKGNSSKKLFDSWNIRDYGNVAPSFEVFCEKMLLRYREGGLSKIFRNGEPTEEELRKLYNKWYKRK